MGTTIKKNGQKCLQWAVQNPKKFFTYSMILLSFSFIGSLIQGVFFPTKTAFKISPPVLYSTSEMSQNPSLDNDKKMEKIVNELKTLKIKRDDHALEKEDSLRIDYLFNQYQKLKNGH
ncbi:hypothetical protein [Chryseobacterium hispalense]|uniref:hypothetical protein n=1 Tax=Chryseobacterium hispalense TaxID=1453492 RepID=UPI00049399AB|nr:hypothetical protein [Chryseobacterium hispalense]